MYNFSAVGDRHGVGLLTIASIQNSDIKLASDCVDRSLPDKNPIIRSWMIKRDFGGSLSLISKALALLIALSIAPTVVHADGNVLPGPAKPRGYSLSDMARATAFFNTGPRDLTFYPDTPFQILYIPPNTSGSPTFVVSPGTMLYVPILYSDDSPPVVGDIHMMSMIDNRCYTTFILRRNSAQWRFKS